MIKFLSIFPCVVFVTAAIAHDGTVTISGTIQDNTCEISPESENKTVQMGTLNRLQFSEVGEHSPLQSFSIILQNCGPAASEASVTFSGKPDTMNSTLFALIDGADVASGLALGIYDSDGHLLAPDVMSKGVALQSEQKSVALEYNAAYVVVSNEVLTGKADAAVSFVINYK